MAIKDKNGNVVKLVRPNPLMQTQDTWDFKNVELINFGWEPVTIPDKRNPIKKFKSDYNIPDITSIINNEIAREDIDIQFEEDEDIQEETIETPEVTQESKESLLNKTELNKTELNKHKVVFLCVMAKEVTINDELYGDSYTRTVYGDKFQFPAIITRQSDVILEFWTETDITINSVVYPQDNSKRWWRVKSLFGKSGGSVVTAIISDVNPDFS